MRRKWTHAEALANIRTGNPSTKAFEALGLPFEAFIRLASGHRTQEDRQRICDAIADRYEGKAG